MDYHISSKQLLAIHYRRLRHRLDEERLRIAVFISPSDYTGHGIDLLEKRLSGTGIWMLQHPDFVAWRDSGEASRTLWCYGHRTFL